MRIAFVYPWFEKFLTNNPELDSSLVDYFLGDFTTPPSLGIPLLKALTPADIETVFIDDNNGETINYAEKYDLVAINCFTPQATRAFEIADTFRSVGTRTIMGGFFPSFMVDECLKHSDSVATGEGETSWPQVIADLRRGLLQKVYHGGNRLPAEDIPLPDRSIFYEKSGYDWEEDLIQVTRGCHYSCSMCSIPEHMGHKLRFRPIDHVITEMKTLKYENVYMADDSLFFPQRKVRDYTMELLKQMAPLNKKLFLSSSMGLKYDKELLDLMVAAGGKNFYCTLNVDPVSARALQGSKKEQQMLVDLVRSLEDRDIRFFGSCGIGRDWDDEGIGDRVLELFEKANIKTSEFFIFSPYPGSPYWNKLEKQGRITDYTWKHYNGAHVVFEPEQMSSTFLYDEFIRIWNEFFKRQKSENSANLEPITYEGGREVVGKPMQEKGVRGESAITGIGIVSPIGHSCDAVLENLRKGAHGISEITRFDASLFTANYAGEIVDFAPEEYLSAHELTQYEDTYLHYAIAAARKALVDAHITVDDVNSGDIALVLATCNGGLLSGEKEYKWKHGKPAPVFDEAQNTQAQYYGFGKALSTALGITAESWIITTACSSTTAAIGLAKTLVDRNYYKTVLVGGSDAYSFANQAGFDGLGATSDAITAPFSTPVGLNIGEASVFWVVEEMEQAILRKQKMYGRIDGHATTSDAYHPTAPDPRGSSSYGVITKALDNAQLKLADMGVINAHGTGTAANDKAEIKGVSRLIAENECATPVVSLKGFFGHCMGATGILEATCNILAMNDGFIPPTLSFKDPRHETALDFVPNTPRQSSYSSFVSSNYAFGGNNAAVVLSQWDAPIVKRETQKNRVVITGLGAVSSLGLTASTLVSELKKKRRGFSSSEGIAQEGVQAKKGGFVPAFTAREVNRRLDFKGLNKISTMATTASFFALAQAGIKVNRKNSEGYGLVLGMCNGPSEMKFMDKIFEGDTPQVDVGSFSNITSNSVAGWVSNLLMLKGENTTLSAGPHAGLQAISYAFDALAQGSAEAILAGGADEVDSQTYFNYDLMEYLYTGADENEYCYHSGEMRKKVLGEGAAVLCLEQEKCATARGAKNLGTILGYGQSSDAEVFKGQALSPRQLTRAVRLALKRSGIMATDVDAICWAPQGNSQDDKVLSVIETLEAECETPYPLFATSMNTGYIEATSSTMALVALLETLEQGEDMWPQITGNKALDTRASGGNIETILVMGSSDMGYNFALVVQREAAI